MGSDRAGDGGVQQAPGGTQGQRAQRHNGVGEFLNHVRRMVVDYIVGQVLSGDGARGADSDMAAADRLDEVTAYYLLHRHDFGMEEAPVGACILYATACGLSDAELDKTWDVLVRTGGADGFTGEDAGATPDDEADESGDGDADAESAQDTGGGSKVKIRGLESAPRQKHGLRSPRGQSRAADRPHPPGDAPVERRRRP